LIHRPSGEFQDAIWRGAGYVILLSKAGKMIKFDAEEDVERRFQLVIPFRCIKANGISKLKNQYQHLFVASALIRIVKWDRVLVS
jgi:hypothetical protein